MQPSRVTRQLGSGAFVMKSHIFGFALLSAAAIVASAPAHAQNGTLTRSFVSSTGVDSNPCTITQPCQSFAQAYTKIGANGIVAALDPGKYGPLTITGPVTINGNGWAAITGPNEGTAISISAKAEDKVILNGLELDGANSSAYGIVFNSGGNLTVTNCTVQNFAYAAIVMQPTSGPFTFSITNTTSSNNSAAAGLWYSPSGTTSATGTIDHVVSSANSTGISINTNNTTGGATFVTVTNSITNSNSSVGIYVGTGQGSTEVLLDALTASGNYDGIVATASTNVLLGHSVITGNTDRGIINNSAGAFYTYQNNEINFNGAGNVVEYNPLTSLSYQ